MIGMASRIGADTDEMEKLARKKLRELNPPAPPRPGVRIRRRKDAPWTLAITGPSSLIADLESSLDENAPLDSVAELFSPSGAAPATRPTITTNAIITLDELDRIIDGDGPAQHLLQPAVDHGHAAGTNLVLDRVATA